MSTEWNKTADKLPDDGQMIDWISPNGLQLMGCQFLHGQFIEADGTPRVPMLWRPHNPVEAAAPTAPHECADPNCPGNINRRKLAAFDELLEACKAAENALNMTYRMAGHGHWDMTMQHGAGCKMCIQQREILTLVEAACDKVRAAIAKATGTK